jgi:hypothetical protein
MKRARRHYGVGLAMIFRQDDDAEDMAYTDSFDNTKMCSNRVDWMIAKASNDYLNCFSYC